jgi:5'-3' exonuclease
VRSILLIDGDQYLFRACAATEKDTKWDDENHVLTSNEVEAWDTVSSSVKKITDHFGNNDAILCFSDYSVPCFRKAVDPTYKNSRAESRKPLCYWDVRARMMEAYKSRSFPGLEADDVMGILATKPGDDEKIIVSRDKDMKTIPGKLWDGMKFYNVSEEQADYWHMYQTLVGDTSDGYKGCPGIGPKKAEAVLHDALDGLGSMQLAPTIHYTWPAVVAAYKKAKLTADDALRQARLARILRFSDWDSKAKTPILWSPPK